MNVCQYFLEPSNNIEISHNDLIVQICDKLDQKNRVECFTILDGHVPVSLDYLKTCKKISREDYIKLSNGWYTPKEYIIYF